MAERFPASFLRFWRQVLNELVNPVIFLGAEIGIIVLVQHYQGKKIMSKNKEAIFKFFLLFEKIYITSESLDKYIQIHVDKLILNYPVLLIKALSLRIAIKCRLI